MDKKELEKSKPVIIKSLVEYSNYSIVSRTILNKETGTVTLFAFDKGQSLSEHTAPFDALVQVIDGKAKIIINKAEYILEKDQLIIMPANIPHAVEALEKSKMLLTMIRKGN